MLLNNGALFIMLSDESKKCPRCQVDFECKAGAITACQCSNIFLNEAERKYVGELYDDCLCVACLMELQTEFSILNHDSKIQQFQQH